MFFGNPVVCGRDGIGASCRGRAGKVGHLSVDRLSFDIYVQKDNFFLQYLAMYLD